MKVVPIRKKPNSEVVTMAKELLQLAESGQIDCLAAAWEGREQEGRCASWNVRGKLWHSQLIGALEIMKSKLVAEADKYSITVQWEE